MSNNPNHLRNFILRNFILAVKDATGPIHISSYTFTEIIDTVKDLCAVSASAMGINIEGWTNGEIMDLVHTIPLWEMVPDCIQMHLDDPHVHRQFKNIWDTMDILTRNHLWQPHKLRQNVVIRSDRIQMRGNAHTTFIPTTSTLSNHISPQSNTVPKQTLDHTVPHSPVNQPESSLLPSKDQFTLMASHVSEKQKPMGDEQSETIEAMAKNSLDLCMFHIHPFLNRKGRRAVQRGKRDNELRVACLNRSKITTNDLRGKQKSQMQPTDIINESKITTNDTRMRPNLKMSQNTSPALSTQSHDVKVLQQGLQYILGNDRALLQLYQALAKDKVVTHVLAAVAYALANGSTESSDQTIKSSNRLIGLSQNSKALVNTCQNPAPAQLYNCTKSPIGRPEIAQPVPVCERGNKKQVKLVAQQVGQAHSQFISEYTSQPAGSTQEYFENHTPKMAADTSKFMPSFPHASSIVELPISSAKVGTFKAEINSTMIQRNSKTESSERTRRSEVKYDALAVTQITGSKCSIKHPIVAQPASHSSHLYSHYPHSSNSNGSLENSTHTLPASMPHSQHHNYWERHKGKYAVKLQSEKHHFMKIIAESPTKVSGNVPASGHRVFEADMIKEKPRDNRKRQGSEYAAKYTEKYRNLSEHFNKRPEVLLTLSHHHEFHKSNRSSSLDSWLDSVKDDIEVTHHPTTYQPYHMNHEQNNVQWCANDSINLGVRLCGAVDEILMFDTLNSEGQWENASRDEGDLMSNSGNCDLDLQDAVNKEYPEMLDQGELENDQDHRIMQERTWESGYYSEDSHQQMSWNEGYGEYLEYIEMMEQNAHYQGFVLMEEEEEAINDPPEEHGDRMIDHFEGNCDQDLETLEQGTEDSGGYYDECEQQSETWNEEYDNYLEIMDTMEQEENYWEK